jgi:hypothetical protein
MPMSFEDYRSKYTSDHTKQQDPLLKEFLEKKLVPDFTSGWSRELTSRTEMFFRGGYYLTHGAYQPTWGAHSHSVKIERIPQLSESDIALLNFAREASSERKCYTKYVSIEELSRLKQAELDKQASTEAELASLRLAHEEFKRQQEDFKRQQEDFKRQQEDFKRQQEDFKRQQEDFRQAQEELERDKLGFQARLERFTELSGSSSTSMEEEDVDEEGSFECADED